MTGLRHHPAARAVAAGLGLGLAAFGAGVLSRVGSEDAAPDVPRPLALQPADVREVVVESNGKTVGLTRDGDGSWSAPGSPPEVVTLMRTFEDRLFPLPAYRTVPGDASDPQYGLAAPEIVFKVIDRDGGHHALALGAPTFSGGGVYARREKDWRSMYLVPRRMMDDLRSLAAGRRVDAPNDLPEKVQRLGEKAQQEATQPEVSWWLRQALDAGIPLPKELG